MKVASKRSASACARSMVSASSHRSADTCVSGFRHCHDPPTQCDSGTAGHDWNSSHRFGAFNAPLAIAQNLVQPFRLGHRLSDFRATVRAFIDEVDLCHAPMRCDVLDVHWQAHTARADNEGWFDVVMVDIRWHVGSPTRHSAVVPDLQISIRLDGCHNHDV